MRINHLHLVARKMNIRVQPTSPELMVATVENSDFN